MQRLGRRIISRPMRQRARRSKRPTAQLVGTASDCSERSTRPSGYVFLRAQVTDHQDPGSDIKRRQLIALQPMSKFACNELRIIVGTVSYNLPREQSDPTRRFRFNGPGIATHGQTTSLPISSPATSLGALQRQVVSKHATLLNLKAVCR